MKTLLIVFALVLSGCATDGSIKPWDEWSTSEQAFVTVGVPLIIGSMLIRNGMQDDSDRICISTRSVETGCGDKF
jgi:ABC-type cobalamin transport system permease subunit